MIDLSKEKWPGCLSPEGMANYAPEKLFTYRRIVSRDDCPHLLAEPFQIKRRAMEEKYGRNSAWIRSMIYGEFVNSESDDAIFEERHINLMRRAMRGEFKPVDGDVRFAGDVSGGGDKMVLMGRQGSEIVLIKADEGQNEIAMADLWHRMLSHLGVTPSQFCVDGGGIGATVANYMEMKLDYYGIVRFMANKGPLDDVAYKDRYTELHWVLRELLEYEVLRLPFCQGLLDDMRQRRYIVMDGDKIKTEPKDKHRKRLNKSPDYLDTMIYLLSDFPINELRGNAPAKQLRRSAEDELTKLEKEAQTGTRGSGGAYSDLPEMPSVQNLAFSNSRS